MLQDCVFCGGQRNLTDYIWLALPYRISKITMLYFFTPVLGIEIQEIRFCDFKDFDIILCQFKKQSFHSILCIFQNKQKMGSLKANLHIYITISTITSVCPSVRFPVSVWFSSQNIFAHKSSWNHPLTPGVDHRGWPWLPPGHAAPPEELARARRALSSTVASLAWVQWVRRNP